MLFRFRRWLRVTPYNLQVRSILKAPPVKLDPKGPTVVTQVCSLDAMMYLVAIKSFSRFVAPSHVRVLNDGSLSPKQLRRIAQHVEGVSFGDARTYPNARCPKGACWERLLTIADLVQEGRYVIQLDADTVTTQQLPDVLECVRQGWAFTLGTELGKEALPVLEARKITANHPWNERERQHVQVVSELAFDRLSHPDTRKYIRGNAAFAGFPPNTLTRSMVETFSNEMEAVVGPKWRSWGSEQLASNYCVANLPNPQVMNAPRYVYHAPGIDLSEAAFVHFIGTYRFDNRTYATMSRHAARELS